MRGAPRRGRMTDIALSRRGDVFGGFSGGVGTVVAGGASAAYVAMIEMNIGRPAGCAMTGVTGFAGSDVICRFSDGHDVVMTAGAAAAYFIVIHPDYRCPRLGAVASAASIGAENVSAGFARCSNQSTGFVTAGALRGSSLE